MSWWRSDGWRDVIRDESDPALARLSLTAAAGRTIGYEGLAAAAEDPDVVMAYHRAGHDESYASDVVAALEAYDRTSSALIASGLPSSVAQSRAALVFGIPAVDGRFLEAAKQTAMPADILVASADEALARAFGHLVDEPVGKADEPWDESSVNRDWHGRFAPEGATKTRGVQPAYRVVAGRKVAVSAQAQQARAEQVEQKRDTAIDEQMLAHLAAQDVKARQEARRKRRKKLVKRRARLEAHKAAVAERERKAAETERKARESTPEYQRQKIAERRAMMRGMSAEQLAAFKENERKARMKAAAEKKAEERKEQHPSRGRRYGSGGHVYTADWDVWADAGYPSGTAAIRLLTQPQQVYTGKGTIDQMDADEAPGTVLLVDPDQAIDGMDIADALLRWREGYIEERGLLNPAGIDLEDFIESDLQTLSSDANKLVEQLRASEGTPIPSDALVYFDSPDGSREWFVPLEDIIDTFLATVDYADDDLRRQDATGMTRRRTVVYEYDAGKRGWGTSLNGVLSMPNPASRRVRPHLDIAKADEPWDESSVVRDDHGRFTFEGQRAQVRPAGGRKALQQVQSPSSAQVKPEVQAQRREFSDADMAWAVKRRQARQRAYKRRQAHKLVTQRVTEVSQAKPKQAEYSRQRIAERAWMSSGLSAEQIKVYQQFQQRLMADAKAQKKTQTEHRTLWDTEGLVTFVTRDWGRLHRDLVELADDVDRIGVSAMVNPVLHIKAGMRWPDAPWLTTASVTPTSGDDDPLFIEPHSMKAMLSALDGGGQFSITGSGSSDDPFQLTPIDIDLDNESTTLRSGVYPQSMFPRRYRG